MRYKKTVMGLNDENSSDDLGDADKLNDCEGDASTPINNTGDMQPDATNPTSPRALHSSHIASLDIEQGKMDREVVNQSASCGLDTMVNSNQGAEVVQCQTSHGSPYLHIDNIDGHLESRKRGRLTKGSAYKPSDAINLKCLDHDENLIKSNKADEMHGTFSQTSAENDDDYDIEEDVKVCDICGDAGREDLLAVCSRCSDGAEHTYCMREMLDKVPDGDWLCEECKYNGEMEERKLEHYKMHGMSDKSRILGRTNSVNNDFVKSDGKDLLRDRSKVKNVGQKKQVSSKRLGDSFEAGPTSKRQAVESSMGTPTASSSSRAAAFKDNRSLDKIKANSFNKIAAGDSSETLRPPITNSLNASKGNFTKSNSFSTSNSKLNVKFSDELQKKKHGIDAKDIPGKSISKSMSFKGIGLGLGRSNVSEPKVKMLSPHCAPVQEFKGPKQGRERISLERKNTIKPDQSNPDQITTITSKHPSRGDISSLCVTDSHDHKNCQPDGKLTTHSKHSFQSHSIHKLSEASDNTEVKRQPSASISGSVPVNGTGSSAEARPNTVSSMELQGLNIARTADRSVIGNNVAKAADVPNNQNEKTVENSLGRLRQGVNGGVAGGNRCELSTDSSISRTKEGIHKENNLKAAIEAAMQKKQDMFRKNRNLDKSNELSTSNSRGNHVGVAALNIILSDASSEEGVIDGDAALGNHISNSCKSVASGGSMKQLNVYPAGGATCVGTVSAIPEQESVWQGGFEIHRNGKFPDMCGGFQAHLSSTAAVKVLESVKKFPQKIVMDEVPRPCVWPLQFKEIGAQEDNVALYFFAKDSESYIRSYKMLVDYLMKHDLALRGRVNEVELLVFPSNHLPDKSQCWNAFFFIWGVLRGRRPLCTDNRSGLQICMSNLVPLSKDVTSTPCDETRMRRNLEKDVNISGGRNVVSRCDTPASVRSGLQHPGTLSNGDCYNERYPRDISCLSSHPSSEKPMRGPNYNFSRSGAEASSASERAPLSDSNDQAPVKVVSYQRLAANKIDGGSHVLKSHESPSYHVQDKQDKSSHSCVASLVRGQAGGLVVGSEEHRLDNVNNIERVKCESSINPDLDCVDNIKKNLSEVKDEDEMKHKVGGIDPMQKNDGGKSKLLCSWRQEGYVDINISADNNMEELHKMKSVMTSQKRSWMNGEDPLEGRDLASTNRRIRGDDLNGVQNPFRPNEDSGVDGVSKEREDIRDEDKSGSSDARYLFIDDSHPGAGVGDESMYWKVGFPEHEERLPGGSPNLELALGVEKKQSRLGGEKDIAASKEDEDEDEDATASLSLSLAFPFSDDKERTVASRLGRPPSTVDAGRHETNTSLLFFRGSSQN